MVGEKDASLASQLSDTRLANFTVHVNYRSGKKPIFRLF